MTPRTIKPHKGGRSERLAVRISPTDQKNIQSIAERAGMSIADWIHAKAAEELAYWKTQAEFRLSGSELQHYADKLTAGADAGRYQWIATAPLSELLAACQ